MVYGCAASTVKCLVVFFNMLACLAGISLIVSGSVGLTIGKKLLEERLTHVSGVGGLDVLKHLNSILIGIIVLGSIIFVMGFLGCAGGLLESPCLLGLFLFPMILLILIQLGVGIAAFVLKDRAEKDLSDLIVKTVNATVHADEKELAKIKTIWIKLMEDFQCCGLDGTNQSIHRMNLTCNVTVPNPSDKDGCQNKVVAKLDGYIIIAGVIVLLFILFELTSVIFVCCLCCSTGERNPYSYR